MIITCDTVEDFFTNLRDKQVYASTVFVNKSIHSLTNDPPRKATSVQVGIQLSAVIYLSDDVEALVQCGEDTGIDRRTANGSTEGTDVFNGVMQRVYEFCQEYQLQLKPGVLGI